MNRLDCDMEESEREMAGDSMSRLWKIGWKRNLEAPDRVVCVCVCVCVCEKRCLGRDAALCAWWQLVKNGLPRR